MSDEFVMPEVFPGDVVLFSRIPEDDPKQPLLVSKVFGSCVNGFWVTDGAGYQGKLFARHVNDPHWREFPDSIQDSGVWKASEPMRLRSRVRVLEAQVEELVGQMAALQAANGRKKKGEPVTA